ncbi:RC3H1 family protein [Megaselia abdita]
MPIQAPQWTEFLYCPVCCNEFATVNRPPISLGCGHTICRACLATLQNKQCPFDQTSITTDLDNLPINNALLQLVSSNNHYHQNNNNNGPSHPSKTNANLLCNELDLHQLNNSHGNYVPTGVQNLSPDDLDSYKKSKRYIEELALLLRPYPSNGVGTSTNINGNGVNYLSRQMQRKIVTLVNCQLIVDEGRCRALRAARSLGERTVTELILQHQNPQQLSSNLWAAVRARGCQFLGPAMQEEVLKLVLLALEDGSPLSRKVLVMFVVQRLETQYPQASKTSIGHVVQLLYRASCFKVSKREGDSSLMQLKEEFRTYDALRREHDAQIVQIATEAGLRIAPDQWSSLLYGDTAHKSHMQSIIDKLQTPQSFNQSIQELVIATQRTGDPANLSNLRQHFKRLAGIDASLETTVPTFEQVANALECLKYVVFGLLEFVQHHGNRKLQESSASSQMSLNPKYKISLCRDLTLRRICVRGKSCTFAHSEEELEKYRAERRKNNSTKMHHHQYDLGGGMHKDEPSTNTPSPSRPSRHHNMMMNEIMNEKISGAPPAGWGMMQPRRFDNYNNNHGNNNFNQRFAPPPQAPPPHIVKQHSPQNNQQPNMFHSSPNNFEHMYKQQQSAAGPPQHLPPPQIPNQGNNYFHELMRQQMWEQRSPTSGGGNNNLLKIPNQQQQQQSPHPMMKNGNESPIFRSMQEKRRVENGNSPYKGYNNNNNNGNIANNNFKEDLFLQASQWSLGGEPGYMPDIMRQTSRESFVRCDSNEDPYIPFEENSPGKFGPISRNARNPYGINLSPSIGNISPGNFKAGGNWPYDDMPITSSPHAVDSLQPMDSKYQYSTQSNESGILSPNKYDLGIGNLSLIDNKEDKTYCEFNTKTRDVGAPPLAKERY